MVREYCFFPFLVVASAAMYQIQNQIFVINMECSIYERKYVGCEIKLAPKNNRPNNNN